MYISLKRQPNMEPENTYCSNISRKTKTFKCWLHGHKEVEPASGISGTCYKMSHGSEEAPGLLKVN